LKKVSSVTENITISPGANARVTSTQNTSLIGNFLTV
jgi:hypothetical protein